MEVAVARRISEWRYWERRMRDRITQYVAQGGGLHELALEAVKRSG
jgi:hypothetical protein